MRRCETVHAALFVALTTLLIGTGQASAQQLEPRAYSPSPVGTNFAGMGYLYSSGGAVTDPSVPITNIHARVNTAAPFYGRTFGLLGRQASVTLTTPYAWARVSGDVQEVNRTVDRVGFADPQIRLSVNLIGNPALTPEEFRRHIQVTTLGTSLTVVAPYGEYDSSKLINLGTNRWAFKPELGLSHPHGNWGFEFYAGVWLFTDNNDFFGGQLRKQDPLASLQTHVVYTIRPRLWAAFDFTYYSGGSTTVDGRTQDDRQNNSRGGVTVSVPLAVSQSVKLTWARGVSTRVGSNFDTMGVVWQLLWF
jgi:hypothetical protein